MSTYPDAPDTGAAGWPAEATDPTSPGWWPAEPADSADSDDPAGRPDAGRRGPGTREPRVAGESHRAATDAGRTHPARLVLGVAALAAEHLRARPPINEVFVMGVGLAQQTVAEVQVLASRTLDWAVARSVLTAGSGPLSRSRDRLNRLLDEAKERGEATLAAGRADASALIDAGVADGIAWAQTQAVPQLVDGLVPYLVDKVLPRLIDGVMPEVRARILPVVIDDLTNDPRLRDLVTERGQGMAGGVDHGVAGGVDHGVAGGVDHRVPAGTAIADERVDATYHRVKVPPGNAT